jgi:PAS domain S-box-containing protein
MQKKNNNQMSSFEAIIQQTSKLGTKVNSFSKTYPAYIVLLLFIIMSIFIWKIVENRVNQDINEQFDKSIVSVNSRIDTKYQKNLEIVKSMSGLYKLLIDVVKDYFELYATVPINTYPSILSVSYIPKVNHFEVGEYVYYVRSQGYYDYSFHPIENKEVYYPIHHLVPLSKNTHRHGLDMGSQPLFLQSLEIARDNNIIVTTQNYQTRDKDTISFFICAPIYVKDSDLSSVEKRMKFFKGILALELNTKTFFENALQADNSNNSQFSFASDSSLIFQIFDKDSNQNDFLVFESKNANILKSGFKPLLTSERNLKFANRNLKIVFYTVPDFGGKIQANLPLISLSVSLLLSFVFFLFVLSVTTSRARAVDLAERMTRSQRRIVEASQDVITVLNPEGKLLSMNPASLLVFGINPEELINKSVLDLVLDSPELSNFLISVNQNKNDIIEKITLKMIHPTDGFKWVNWSLTYSLNDNLIYATGRDVTLEKLAEEQTILKNKQIQLAETYALEASESKTYFMIKLSHQLRNSLTSIIGYIQLLTQKLYDSEEEHDTFLDLAEQSSEEIFTFVSDIVDATVASGSTHTANPDIISVGYAFELAYLDFCKDKNSKLISRIDFSDESKNTKALADFTSMKKVFEKVLEILSTDSTDVKFDIVMQENPYEGATEIQILASPNSLVESMINIYKANSRDIINYLKNDNKDILFEISKIASYVRRLNGSFVIDSLGSTDGNLITIQLPLNKTV